jgi:GTP-sensing pleiotropic transcriptional regulator CodY
LYASRGDYSEVIDYNTFVTNTNETFWGTGLQYTFSDKIKAQLFYQQFSWEDELSEKLPYQWDNWQINFYMAF